MKKIKFGTLTIFYKFPRYGAYEIGFVFGKIVFFRMLPNYVNRAKNIFLETTEDIDCDGCTWSITDRLTGGKIYRFYGWNFSRVGGSVGHEKKWFDFTD